MVEWSRFDASSEGGKNPMIPQKMNQECAALMDNFRSDQPVP